MTNQQNKSAVTFTATGIEPVAATFNIRSSDLVNFATEYFSKLDVDIAAVELGAPQTGSVAPRLSLHVFIKSSSEDLIGGGRSKAKSLLSNRIENRGVEVSERFEKAIAPFALENTRVKRTKDPNFFHVELEPLLLVALYLAADDRTHNVGVIDVRPIGGGELIITAIKARANRNKRNNKGRSMMSLIK